MGQHHVGQELLVIGVLLLAAFILARIVRRINLPAIPIYILVGMFFSTSTTWFPLELSSHTLDLVAVLGLVMLLFSLGLEFDSQAFTASAGRMILGGVGYIVINLVVGLAFGAFVGWGWREMLLLGGIIATSSSAIVTKLMIGLRRLTSREAPVILGVTVVEDIFIALYLVLASILLGGEQTVWQIVLKAALGPVFLVTMFFAARKGSGIITRITRVGDSELFTILFFALAILFAGIGEVLGVTDAIGAFLIGMVLGAGKHRDRFERVSEPLRDVFGAFFFISFGLGLDPRAFLPMAPIVGIAVVITILSSLLASYVLLRINSMSGKYLFRVSFVLQNRGEFALILAALAIASGVDGRIQSFTGLYVLIMSIVGPLLAAHTDRLQALWVRGFKRNFQKA